MSIDGRGWNLPTPPLDGPFELNTDSPQATGLLAWWPMLGSRGASSIQDKAGIYAGTGTLVGGTWVANGVLGMGASFASDAQYITVGTLGALGSTVLAAGFSISEWLQCSTKTATRPCFGAFNSGANTALRIRLNSDTNDALHAGYIDFYLRPNLNPGDINCEVAVDTGVTDGAPHLVCAVCHTAIRIVEIYLDGKPQTVTYANAGAAGGTYGNFAYAVGLGCLNGRGTITGLSPGAIYEGRIASRLWTGAECWQMYDPATRWELYRPTRRWWPKVIGGAVSISPDLASLGGVNIGGVA